MAIRKRNNEPVKGTAVATTTTMSGMATTTPVGTSSNNNINNNRGKETDTAKPAAACSTSGTTKPASTPTTTTTSKPFVQSNKSSKSSSPSRKNDNKSSNNNKSNNVNSNNYNKLAMPLLGIVTAMIFFMLGLVTPPLLRRPSSTLLMNGRSLQQQQDTPTMHHHASLSDHDHQQQQQQQLHQGAAVEEEEEMVVDSTEPVEVIDPCRREELEQFLHDEIISGFHIVCLEPDENYDDNNNIQYGGDRDEQDPPTTMKIRMFRGGIERTEYIVDLPMPVSWSALKSILEPQLRLPPATNDIMKQPWAIYSKIGERLVSGEDIEGAAANDDGDDEGEGEGLEIGSIADWLMRYYGLLLVYEGGQFLWPGVRIGFQRQADLYSIMPDRSDAMPAAVAARKNRTVTLETLSLFPLVLAVQGFLSQEECDHVQAVAEPHIEYSGVVLMEQDVGKKASEFRTSQSTFISANNDVMLQDIDWRTASLVRVPRDHQESVQVLRYGYTERYVSHHDYFDPAFYSHDQSTLNLIGHGRRNRLATVFWYLTTVPEGGETVFPRFNRGRERSFEDCETGLLVKPEAGKVIIFYSLTADGKRDPHSLHGACPVKEGIKWAANKWVWNEKMNYVS